MIGQQIKKEYLANSINSSIFRPYLKLKRYDWYQTKKMAAQINNPAQIYDPNKSVNLADDPSKELVRHLFGYILTIILVILAALSLYDKYNHILKATDFENRAYYTVYGVGILFYLLFSLCLLLIPTFAAGNPPFFKFWLLHLGFVLEMSAYAFLYIKNLFTEDSYGNIIAECGFYITMVLIFGANDESNSCCLWFKPWVYKTKMVPYHVAYPPQNAQNLPQV